MGKRKAETPAQRTARLERARDQRTASYLRFLVGVAMHPWVSRTSVFLAGDFTQALFHTSYISKTCAHCILDKTYAHVIHTGVHRHHPLPYHAAYNTAQARPQR